MANDSVIINETEYIRKDVHDKQIAALQRQRETDYHTTGKSMFQMVGEFHEKFDLVINDRPMDFSRENDDFEVMVLFDLRHALHREEWEELEEAWMDEDLVRFADAICDLIYVLCGTAVSFGIPLDECFAEVQRSNMSKLGEDGQPIKRKDGKILKGPNFSKPDLRSIIYGKA